MGNVKVISEDKQHLIEIERLLELYNQPKQNLIKEYSKTPNHLTENEIELVEQHFLLDKSLNDGNLTSCERDALLKISEKYHTPTESNNLNVVYKVR